MKFLASHDDETSGNTLHCKYCSSLNHFKKDIANETIHECDFVLTKDIILVQFSIIWNMIHSQFHSSTISLKKVSETI
jgi:hypothetical protein